MNKLIRVILFYSFWMPQILFGQAFQNLDFDSADVSPPGGFPARVPFANAFPGWNGSLSTALYNAADLDQMTIGAYSQSVGTWGPHPLLNSDGYTAYLEGDLSWFFPNSGSVGIWQTGVIPADAKSIQFYSTIAYGSALPGYSPTLTLSLNGTSVPFSPIGTSGEFIQYSADVSSYAGTSTSLRFDVSAIYPYPEPSPFPQYQHWIFGVGIDDISFSATPAPEPATITLFGLGLLFFIFKLRRKSIFNQTLHEARFTPARSFYGRASRLFVPESSL